MGRRSPRQRPPPRFDVRSEPGRIVGETAALIFTAGTFSGVAGGVMESGRTLAVHMYCLLNEGLRRSEAYQPTVLAYGDLTLDPGSGNLRCGREAIRLSGREFQIMELFLRSPRQVFSAERIMERVWGWDNEAEINVVWVNISNLRKKLKSIGSHVTLQANRGLGYVLEESV